MSSASNTGFRQHNDESLNSSRGSQAMNPLEYGCLRLGDDESIGSGGEDVELRARNKRAVYVTRYRIDHHVQSRRLCHGVACEECTPCCTCIKTAKDDDEEEEERPVSWIWYLVSSELLIFTLHMSAIVFGVVKEALDMRHIDALKPLHMAHSVVETVATLCVVILHTLSARMAYVKVRESLTKLEHFDASDDAQLASIRTWAWVMVAVGFVYVGACVGCFIAFYAWAHLGWTVLSNQAIIASLSVLVGLYESRGVAAEVKIRLDQHKVVIHEALMLLREHCGDSDRARRFIDAVSNTKALARPKYINVTCTSQQNDDINC